MKMKILMKKKHGWYGMLLQKEIQMPLLQYQGSITEQEETSTAK